MNEEKNNKSNSNICHNCDSSHTHNSQTPPEDWFDNIPQTVLIIDDTGDLLKNIGLALMVSGILYDCFAWLSSHKRVIGYHLGHRRLARESDESEDTE